MPRTQRSKRRRASRNPAVPATLALVAVLVAGVGAVGVLSSRSGGDGAADVREVARPAGLTAPASTPASASASASASPSASAAPAGATSAPAAGATSGTGTPQETAPPAVAAYDVVPGRRIRAKTETEVQAQEAARAAREQARIDAQPFTFTLGSFNVLGSQHTAPGGDHPRYPPASVRSAGAAGLMASHGVDIVGTQELQPDQLNALTSRTGMAAYPGYAFGDQETDNSILYDDSRFDFVSGGSFIIRFMNADRPQTVLRLRDRGTGREFYVVNMHASAGEGQYAVSRRAGHERAIAEINELKESGLPVFLTGDMNDREEFFCRVAPPTGLVAAIGGSTSGGCSPASALAVDWVMGTDVDWSDYWEDRSPLGNISDHHFVSATASVEGKPKG